MSYLCGMKSACFVALATLALASPARGAEIVVASEALDPKFFESNMRAFVGRLEAVGGWRKGSLLGTAFSRPRDALDHMRKNKTAFALLPVHQFVEGRKDLKLEVLGRAVGIEGADPGFWGVARNEPRPYQNVEQYPGLRLALTEAYDTRWINVLFEGNVKAKSHFELVEVPSGPEAVAAVLARKADVALVYERDFQPLRPRIEARADLAWVYASGGVPPPPFVATRWASGADRRRFAAAIGKLCKGEGAALCSRMTIMYAEPGRATSYDRIIAKYETYR